MALMKLTRGKSVATRTLKTTRIQRNVLDLEPLEDRSTPATLTVTNLASDGAGSLRQAINDANFTSPGPDTIVFVGAAIGGTISLTGFGSVNHGPSGLEVSTEIIIQGSGETITRDGAASAFRLFYVSPSANLILSNLTLNNGYARGGDGGTNLGDDGGGGGGGLGAGGAIYNQGTLTIVSSTLTNNVAQGGIGGAGANNAGSDAGGGGGGGGMGGNGGTTPDNSVDGGAGGGGFFGNGAGGAALVGGGGGGNANNAVGAVGGVANGGAGGAGNVNGTAGGIGGGGGGGGDEAAGGAGGIGGGGGGSGEDDGLDDANPGGAGGFGGGGGGGGEDNAGGAGGFGGGGGGGSNITTVGQAGGLGGFQGGPGGTTAATRGSGGGGGGAGLGGAIFNDAGTVTITNSTLSGNLAVGGLGGAAGGTAAPGTPGFSSGGGAFNRNGSLTISSSTISSNGSVFGRGIHNVGDGATATVTLHNSILGQGDVTNSDYDDDFFGGTVVSSGSGNLIRVNSGFAGGIVSTADPLLGALQNNGGLTFTRLPGAGSPAVNAGNNAAAAAISIDQRGFSPRIFGGTVDIGSIEVGASKLPPATLIGAQQFGVGTDVGDGSVKFFNPDSTLRFTLTPFPGQPGGIRTAAGDFTGDGIADLVVGTGPGGPTHVKVFNGSTQAEFFSIDPFEAAFTGGVYVAAGDITGDGVADLVITPDEGGGPRVRAFTGSTFTQIADFFGIDDPNFRGGARAAIGDLNGDGRGDLVIVAGFGGGPRVAAFDGKQFQTTGGPKLFDDFFAFEQTLRNGIFVAAGDVNGDGFADLVAGGGPGGGPRVFILDGKSLVQNGSDTLVPVGNFFAGDPASRGGVRVAIKNLDNDILADVVTGAGTGAGSRITAYRGTNIVPLGGTPPAFLDFDAFAGFGGGVFVG